MNFTPGAPNGTKKKPLMHGTPNNGNPPSPPVQCWMIRFTSYSKLVVMHFYSLSIRFTSDNKRVFIQFHAVSIQFTSDSQLVCIHFQAVSINFTSDSPLVFIHVHSLSNRFTSDSQHWTRGVGGFHCLAGVCFFCIRGFFFFPLGAPSRSSAENSMTFHRNPVS